MLRVVGADETLGSWDLQQGINLLQHHINEWIVDIDVTRQTSGFHQAPVTLEFKFVSYGTGDAKGYADYQWEQGENRFITLPDMQDGDMLVYELPQAYFPVPPLKCAGTLIPVFSLRSKSSFGVGDFGDLKKMIDWVASTHQRLLQILPIILGQTAIPMAVSVSLPSIRNMPT